MKAMNFFESFRKPKKTEAETEAEYISAHEELKSAIEGLSRAHAEHAKAVSEARQTSSQAKESFESSLKELEDLNS
jgi:hypothetical protein